MTIPEQMHAAFIEFMKSGGWRDEHLARTGDDYANWEIQSYWLGFVAGWQAVKV